MKNTKNYFTTKNILSLVLIVIMAISIRIMRGKNKDEVTDKGAVEHGTVAVKEKNLTVVPGSKPRSLDPYKFNEFPALMITEHIYNTLISLDDSGKLIPELATAWKIVSPTEIEFTLKKGIKFHNGNEFKANDVVYSFNRMKNSPGSSIAVDNLDRVEATGDYKVKMYLKKPSSPFIASLASPLLAIMDEEYSKDNEENIGFAPNGTGPFAFVDWKDGGEKIILKGNKEYFNGAPKIDGLTFWIITETANRIIALETGEAQIAYAISPFDSEKIKDHKDIDIATKLTATTDYLALNLNKKIFNSRELREAISLAINKEGIIESLLFGKGQVAKSIVNPKIWGSSDDKIQWEYNPEKAKELIEKNNLTGTSLSLWVSDNPTRVQIAQIIQANLKEIGINVQIYTAESGAFLQKTAAGEHDLLLTTWFIGAPDADTILRSLVYSKSVGSAGNRSFYRNDIIDRDIEKAEESFNTNERLKLYEEIQKNIAQDIPVIPITHRYDTMAMSKKVKNYQYNRATLRNRFEVIDIEE